ncbi:MAG TPA: helix-turn-helix domain-containing protein [Archangium sp.]|nr:helix-turn-helix domain-containing protein [Archangium sp.]
MTAVLQSTASTLTQERVLRPAPPRSLRDAHLLSLREAARRLGMDRKTTLMKLICTGQLRGVETGGRLRIPASEIERFTKLDRPGEPPPTVPAGAPPAMPQARKTRQRRRPRPAASPDIRDLDF